MPTSEPFRPVVGGGGKRDGFTGDRGSHGRRLKTDLEEALDPSDRSGEAAGSYITFESFPGLELALTSLDPQLKGDQPQLVAVRDVDTPDGPCQLATVFVPDGKRAYFIKKLNAYIESVDQDNPANAPLVEGIQSIRRATIRDLWTDPDDEFPTGPDDPFWWEVWLRNRGGDEMQRLSRFTSERGLRLGPQSLGFGDRTVVLLHATADELADALTSMDDIAELRRPHVAATFLADLEARDQAEWVDELLGRLTAAGADAPYVCILDTGVQGSHPLLAESLHEDDMHAVDPTWPLQPRRGHGTEMAGLALFGDLEQAVASTHPVTLRHRLESVKILPNAGDNDPDLYGAITARGVDRPEIVGAHRKRAFMLAVTAQDATAAAGDAGRPTAWSATVDALAFGRAIDDTDPSFTYLDRDEPRLARLFLISAGNISPSDLAPHDAHLGRCDTEAVEDPAQAWNAITVGAYSDRDDMTNAPHAFAGWTPLAPRGELSPVSRTSVLFDRTKWPVKPDVVADGGNLAVSPERTAVDTPENLALLTTRLRPQSGGAGLFTTTRDTSAATAQVAALAADIWAAYPDLRPETVRALVVHSAEWTDIMRGRLQAETCKSERVSLLRRYGMGVPDLTRALRSATDAVTLVAESRIHPYDRDGQSGNGRIREMNLHLLPWPKEQLEVLGAAEVKLRVTLSYFIEPNPSRRGWAGRYAYPSHGLRFAMRRPTESIDDFRRRINAKARADEGPHARAPREDGWFFGANHQQSPGSLHTDIWTGSAADLASKNALAIYPVAGWWKTRAKFDQSEDGVDYSLIVSIQSPEVEVDLWTPIANQVAASVPIVV